MLRLRRTICWPVWFRESPAPRRSAWRMALLPLPASEPKFGSDTKQGRQQRRLEQLAPMMIDLVLKPGISRRIGTRLALKDDRSAVRHDQACPDQEHARLAEVQRGCRRSRSAARPAGINKSSAGRRINRRFGHMRRDLPGQIGADARDKGGRNHGPGLDDITEKLASSRDRGSWSADQRRR